MKRTRDASGVERRQTDGGSLMTPETADDLAKASVILMMIGIVFALAGELRSAIAIEAIGILAGIVGTYGSPIEPWH